MRLFKLTLATIFQRKVWAICAFVVLVFPYALTWISSASENPVLVQPARVQAAWSVLWFLALAWGLFTAAREGENNVKSGLGEYFHTTGVGPTRQLFQIWLAVFCYVIPLVIAAVLVCQIGEPPGNPVEKEWWWKINLQYSCLFILVIGPLLALSVSLASRFGGIAGFSICVLLALYGLYGVEYLDSMLKMEENPLLKGVLVFSPQYRFADLTQRMYFKSGPLTGESFGLIFIYFTAVAAVYAGIARLCFRTKEGF